MHMFHVESQYRGQVNLNESFYKFSVQHAPSPTLQINFPGESKVAVEGAENEEQEVDEEDENKEVDDHFFKILLGITTKRYHPSHIKFHQLHITT